MRGGLTTTTLAVMVCGTIVTHGQQPGIRTGSITGVIVTAFEPTPVPDAPIQARNTATGTTSETRSAPNGRFSLSGLSPGTYVLSAQYPPLFIPFEQDGIEVQAGQTMNVDIHLKDPQATLGDGGSSFVKLIAEQPAPRGPTPRTRDRKPDLNGVWLPNVPRPVGDLPQPLPWAAAIAKERADNLGKDSPMARCLPGGLSMTGTFSPYRLVHTPGLLVIIDEIGDPPRQIYLDGRRHPKDPNPTYMGHSIGHWEGDTLVVDTIGFNDRQWLTIVGFPLTEKLHVVERFRRPDLGHLEIELSFDDQGTFAKPFRLKRVSSLAPADMELFETVCENNKFPQHAVGK